MPTYQYACTACGHQLEAVQSFSDPALTQCPVCDGRLRKLFSAVGIVFKGAGFYRTDSRSAATTGEATTTSPKAETASSSAGTDTKSSDSSSTGTPATPAKSTAAATSS